MIVRKRVSRRTLKSDLAKVDLHSILPHEYKELPALTEKALSRAIVKKGGRPRSANPRKLFPFGFLWTSSNAGKRPVRAGRRVSPTVSAKCVDRAA